MYLASGQELLHCNLIKLLFKNILECHFLPDLPYASTLSNSESVALDLIWNRSPPRIKNSRQYRYMPSESVLVCHVWFSARCWPATQEDCTLKMVSVPQECHENMCFISLILQQFVNNRICAVFGKLFILFRVTLDPKPIGIRSTWTFANWDVEIYHFSGGRKWVKKCMQGFWRVCSLIAYCVKTIKIYIYTVVHIKHWLMLVSYCLKKEICSCNCLTHVRSQHDVAQPLSFVLFCFLLFNEEYRLVTWIILASH